MIKETYTALNASAVELGKALPLNASSDATALPKRIKIFEWGENIGRTTGAKILVNEHTLSVLPQNQEENARELVALDYEHQTVPGHSQYKQPPHHVAGHSGLEVVAGEGVYLNSLSYTPNGEEFAANYPDVSPVAFTDADNNLIFVHSVALTQNGDVAGLEFAEALSATLNNPTNNPSMDTDKNKDKNREMLIELLGLKPIAGDDYVTDEAIADAIAKKTADKSTPAPEADKDKGEMVAMSARLDRIERQAIVDKACAAGKKIPLSAEQIDEMSLVTLSAMVENLPANQVPIHPKGTATEKPTDAVALSADETALCERLGISEDDFKKQQ